MALNGIQEGSRPAIEELMLDPGHLPIMFENEIGEAAQSELLHPPTSSHNMLVNRRELGGME